MPEACSAAEAARIAQEIICAANPEAAAPAAAAPAAAAPAAAAPAAGAAGAAAAGSTINLTGGDGERSNAICRAVVHHWLMKRRSHAMYLGYCGRSDRRAAWYM